MYNNARNVSNLRIFKCTPEKQSELVKKVIRIKIIKQIWKIMSREETNIKESSTIGMKLDTIKNGYVQIKTADNKLVPVANICLNHHYFVNI